MGFRIFTSINIFIYGFKKFSSLGMIISELAAITYLMAGQMMGVGSISAAASLLIYISYSSQKSKNSIKADQLTRAWKVGE